MMEIVQILAGLLMLVTGGEGLVRGSVSIAKTLRVPVMVIGLTIVSIGTSAPEMIVSVLASVQGHPDIALGNIIGSNIANILLVLAITALIWPVRTNPEVTQRDGIIMVGVSFLLMAFMNDLMITQTEGAILLTALLGYIVNMYRLTRKKSDPRIIQEFEEGTQFDYPWFISVPLMAVGIALLLIGAEILVDGASDTARVFGVSEGVIGATIVAFGTCAPELITCVVAACRKHSDIAVGNIIGSNLFNISGVIGVAAFISPLPVEPQFLRHDIWVMLVCSTLLIPLMMTDKRITRAEGSVMLSWYLLYLIYQFHLKTV